MIATLRRNGGKLYRNLLFLYPVLFRNAVFIHINKTGGSSIEKAMGLPLLHKTAQEYYHILGARRWQQRFSFTIVRNPWDKVVSQYHYRCSINETRLRDRPLPFGDWVQRVFVDRDPQYLDEPRFFMPQMAWICNARGDILVDFVGRFESLQQDWQFIRNKTACPVRELPHIKKSRHGDYRRHYDTRSADAIARYFADDIQAFGYRFDSCIALRKS